MPQITDFTNDPEVQDAAQRADQLRSSGKHFSDIIDSEGHQYVDLVQEGGGTLGIALVGYLYILEQAGIRPYSLAGTSAGAINTMMIAAYQQPGQPIAEKILEVVSKKNLFDLVDGRHRGLIDSFIKGKKLRSVFLLLFTWPWILSDLLKHKGLNPGNDFIHWIQKELHKVGINTMKDIYSSQERLQKYVTGRQPGINISKPRMAVITSDITTHTKTELPTMDHLYWKDADATSYHPAEIVRASMSVPLFFYPYVVDQGIPNAGKERDDNWINFAKYFGKVPDRVLFVDGGMLSNFPINIFHRKDGKAPTRPTFGARLSTWRDASSNTSRFFGFVGAMIGTMRQIYDYDFILRNPDYKQLICHIDADKKYNWLDFNLSDEDQIGLFRLGATRAIRFLENFDWEKYKAGRS